MAQVSQQGERRDGQLRHRLRSRWVAWWFGLLARVGVVHFGTLFVLLVGLAILSVGPLDQAEPSVAQTALAFGVAMVVALAVGIHLYREQPDLLLPATRVPHKRWRSYATGTAASVAAGVAYVTWWLWVFLLAGLFRTVRLMISVSPATGTIFKYLTIPGALLLATWAFVAWRYQQLVVLEEAQPPELRLSAKVTQYADEFQERAKALEKAMEEAAAISKQVQHGIELDQQQLAELREEYQQQARRNALAAEDVSAIEVVISRSGRSGVMWTGLFTVIGWALGVLTVLVVDLEGLGQQIRQWLFHS
jgi:hypothetical protein